MLMDAPRYVDKEELEAREKEIPGKKALDVFQTMLKKNE